MRLAIGLERYVLVNFIMNCIVIGVIARFRGRNRWGLTLFAAAFGALFAVAMQYPAFYQLRWWPSRIALTASLAAVAIRMDRPKDLAINTFLLLGGAVFLSGAVNLAGNLIQNPGLALITGAIFGTIGMLAFLAVRARRMEKWEMMLRLIRGDRRVELNALVDTGNRLQEPISGQPVVIAAEHKLRNVLPVNFQADMAADRLPPGFRLVGYKSLSGTGKMVCFRPDELLVSMGDGWLSAPDVWVAVYPGKLPGNVYALAPPVLGRVHNVH
jgi:stage II sporulation protein GA (sporulation sigma-E factor processing peptidase)